MSKRQEAMVIIKGSQGRKALEVHQGNLHLPGTKVHFFGYCYSCSNFGHMANDCEESHRDRCYSFRQPPRNNFRGRNHESCS